MSVRAHEAMFAHAINKSDRQRELDELLKKHAPKPIRQYEENGVTITVYEVR